MKVIAQTSALQDALALAGGIVVARSPKPVLQCIKLVAADDTLTVMATDQEVGCRYLITSVKVEQPGEALIPADRLAGIVREAGSDESLTIETDGETVLVTGAGSEFKLYGYDPAEYPTVGEFTDAADFEIPSAVLGDMIAKTVFATAKAHSHYAISGVLWEAEGTNLQLVATDGHRLAQARGSLSTPATEAKSAIVPAKLMSMLQRSNRGDERLEIKIAGSQIFVRTMRMTLVSSLVQGNFPKYEDVIPTGAAATATIPSAEFQHRVRQAALLTNEESRGVQLSFAPGVVRISGRGPETGEAKAECAIQYDGDEVQIGFNPAFLIDAMKVIDTDEIALDLTAANKPALVRSGNDFLYVIMPVDIG